MNAIELLRAQHRKIEWLLEELQSLSEKAVRRRHRLVAQLGDLLSIHAALEERIFYPGVNRASTEDLLLKSLEEHLSVKRLLADLLQLEEWMPTFAPKVEVLREQVLHHIAQEEERLFTKVEMLVPHEQLELMGMTMERATASLEAQAPRFDVLAQTDGAWPLE